MNKEVQEKTIKGHDIYIFEKHHYALFPWLKIKIGNKKNKLVLFSLDHHTDTHDPFSGCCNCDEEKMQELISKIMINDEESIEAAVLNLRNDEQIKTALRIGLFEKAFIISHSNSFDDIPMSIQEKERMEKVKGNDKEYLMRCVEGDYGITPRADRIYDESEIYIPPFVSEGVYEYGGENDDVVLEDEFLEEKMVILSRMCPDIVAENGNIRCDYILDIDLDYFHTMRAVEPLSRRIFSQLVKSAKAITIAKESVCVESVRSEESVTSDKLLEKLLKLLEIIYSEG